MLSPIPCLAGLLFGFASAIPVAGPLSALILARSMGGRYRSARGLAIGVAAAESAYAFAAYLGAGVLLVQHPAVLPAARGLTAVIMLALGVLFVLGRSTGPATPEPDTHGFGQAAAVGLGLALLNPSFLATWSVAATALLGTGWVVAGAEGALGFGLGAGLGTFAWFGSVPGMVRRHRDRLSQEAITRLGRATGWALIAVAVGLTVGLVGGDRTELTRRPAAEVDPGAAIGNLSASTRPLTDIEPPGSPMRERFAPPPSTPNCVSSKADPGDRVHFIAPLALPAGGLQAAEDAIRALPRTEIEEREDAYLHAVFTTRIFSWKDDLELLVEGDVLHVRSASRVGRGDLGANRQRVEALRRALAGS